MADGCELCRLDQVLFEADEAYVRYDNNRLSNGTCSWCPPARRRFLRLTAAEKASIIELLDKAKTFMAADKPDGYNIGVNIGRAGGQSRMHVHVHLIPRYTGDVADPRGGIRCVLANRKMPSH